MTPLPPVCEAALRELDALRRGELSAEQAAVLRAHLDSCRFCLGMERFERAFLDRLREAAADCNCPEELRQRIQAQCAQSSHGG
ncbi:MAG TPA: zf-HC2 domain-containing protein [Gemmatimonadales bacterium]|jgi:hypothetical protein|nr:zf-HC2 domain-containing protein [Gemmatimonadales bacterium]